MPTSTQTPFSTLTDLPQNICKNKVGAAVELESQRLYGLENRIFADIDTIPEHVKNAFIAIEDHRFYEHNGVDIYRTGGAVLSFISPSAQGYGGSTITQQLVKILREIRK